MTKSQIFTESHKVAARESRKFGIPYRQAFANALSGFQAVARGYTGSFVKGF